MARGDGAAEGDPDVPPPSVAGGFGVSRPLALLVKVENGYHVQGPVDTVQALISIVDGVMVAAKGSKIPMNPTPDEVIAGLREAFPSRVEFANLLVPTASGPAVSARGDFQINPISAWTCS